MVFTHMTRRHVDLMKKGYICKEIEFNSPKDVSLNQNGRRQFFPLGGTTSDVSFKRSTAAYNQALYLFLFWTGRTRVK